MATDRMLDLLFTPFTAVFFIALFIGCIVLLMKSKISRAPLIFIIALCCVYFLCILYVSLGFGADIPPAATPAPPR